MSDTNDWTPDQIHYFQESFRALKEANGNEPFALPPWMRATAIELGLLPPLSVQIETKLGGMVCRGLLHLDEDGIYRGKIHVVKGPLAEESNDE